MIYGICRLDIEELRPAIECFGCHLQQGCEAPLANLDNSTIRGWTQGYLRDNYRVEVDYETFSVSPFSGLKLEKLHVATPAPYSQKAPHLLEIDKLQVEWDFWSLITGTLHVNDGRIKGMRLALVSDEQGGSSLSQMLTGFGPPAPDQEVVPPTPLSRTLIEGLPPLTVEKFAIDGIGFEKIDIRGDTTVRHTRLSSLALDLSLSG